MGQKNGEARGQSRFKRATAGPTPAELIAVAAMAKARGLLTELQRLQQILDGQQPESPTLPAIYGPSPGREPAESADTEVEAGIVSAYKSQVTGAHAEIKGLRKQLKKAIQEAERVDQAAVTARRDAEMLSRHLHSQLTAQQQEVSLLVALLPSPPFMPTRSPLDDRWSDICCTCGRRSMGSWHSGSAPRRPASQRSRTSGWRLAWPGPGPQPQAQSLMPQQAASASGLLRFHSAA